jgi:two-component system, sensor histidine kinase and response regulator
MPLEIPLQQARRGTDRNGRNMSEADCLGMPDRKGSRSRTTLLIVACYFALTLSMLPWAQRPGPELPGLVPFFVAGVLVTELATSFLLFLSFSATRSWSLLLLASAYLYSGLMPIAHLLTFPGAVFPAQAVVGTQQSTAWIFIVWILGYALITAIGVLAEARQPALRVAPEKVTHTLASSVLGVVMAVLVITFVAANWGEQLPPLCQPELDHAEQNFRLFDRRDPGRDGSVHSRQTGQRR